MRAIIRDAPKDSPSLSELLWNGWQASQINKCRKNMVADKRSAGRNVVPTSSSPQLSVCAGFSFLS
jgi:hypothetical protein